MVSCMVPKTLLTADLHLSDTARDSYRWDIFPWLIEQVKSLSVERIIILGDVTEYKDGHNARFVNRLVDTLINLGRYCDVVILRGNHDGLSPDCPFFGFTGKLKYITWISAPVRKGEELFLPHTDNYKKDWKALTDDFDKATTYFCHQTFVGATAESGSKLDGVPLNIIPCHAQVYSGDIHKPQCLGPVTYIGAPYTIRFGDDYNPRIILLKGTQAVSIPVPGVRKHLFEITSPAQLTAALAAPGDLVKIRVRLLDEASRWGECRAEIVEAVQRYGWRSCGVQPIVENTISRLKPQTSPNITDRELMHEFAARQKINDTRLQTGMEFVDAGD